MRFDYTKGKPVRYIVSLYSWSVEDKYCFHYFNEAKALYEKLRDDGLNPGTLLSVYDTITDECKVSTKV